jgi:hypothetical protein
MISIVIPVHYRNASLLVDDAPMAEDGTPQFIGSLPALAHHSKDSPVTEVIVVTEGGKTDDWSALHRYIETSSPLEIKMLASREITNFQNAAAKGLLKATADLIMVMAPSVVVEDNKWFGKAQSVFIKTPHPGFLSIIEGKMSCAAPQPILSPSTVLPINFFVTNKRVVETCLVISGEDPIDNMQRNAHQTGFRRWEHSGIRHFNCSSAPHRKIKMIL